MTKQEFFVNWNPAFGVEASGEPQEANKQFIKELTALIENACVGAFMAGHNSHATGFKDLMREFEDWHKQQNEK